MSLNINLLVMYCELRVVLYYNDNGIDDYSSVTFNPLSYLRLGGKYRECCQVSMLHML